MKKFSRLEIEVENSGAAFDGREALVELARLLRQVLKEIEGGADDYEHLSKALLDVNGNRCGHVSLEMDEVEPDGWLCEDCVMFVVNGDLTGVDAGSDEETEERCAEIETGAESLGDVNVDGDVEEEFSRRDCDCCGTALAGRRVGYYEAP